MPPSNGPLEGLRVVELVGIGPAPHACQILSDLGADVLAVDRVQGPGVADPAAEGRPRILVDLKSSEGREQVLGVVSRADVLVEGFRPGAAERLGLGPKECSDVNPGLIYARMTGWGQDGPLAARAGHDINYLAVIGGLHAMGEAGSKPVVPLNLVGDFGGGSMFLLLGVLAALHERQTSGLGQVVDVAIVDGVAQLMSMTWNMRNLGVWSDSRGTNLLDGGAHFYATYACSDGRYIAVGAVEPQFYAQLLSGLAISDLSQDSEDWARGTKELAEVFATRTRDEWEQVFEGTDACVTPVLSLAEAPQGRHVTARGTLPTDGSGQVRPAPAPRFSRTPGRVAVAGTVEDLLARWSAGNL